MSMSACPSMRPLSPLSACLRASSTIPRAQGVLEDDREDRDHQQPARKLSRNELPAEQDQQHDAELEDEVGAGELEQDGVDEGRSPAKEPAGDGDRGVGAAGAGGAEERRERYAAKVVLAERTDDRLLGDDRLHDRGDDEAKRERPQDLPEHEEGHLQRLPDGLENKHGARTSLLYNRFAGPIDGPIPELHDVAVWILDKQRAVAACALDWTLHLDGSLLQPPLPRRETSRLDVDCEVDV